MLAGAIGVLTGVEYLLSKKAAVAVPMVAAPVIELSTPEPRPAVSKARLKVSQTRSELGYVYWVVREFGANPSYALFDTWREAMDEVTRRLSAAAVVVSNEEPVLVLA
ncbi:MAG: hypothetical protein JO051_11730 [Acidobacteriaceae bacterium]|nr:hypothetical protein [Acidobacteriaceae bacterium]